MTKRRISEDRKRQRREKLEGKDKKVDNSVQRKKEERWRRDTPTSSLPDVNALEARGGRLEERVGGKEEEYHEEDEEEQEEGEGEGRREQFHILISNQRVQADLRRPGKHVSGMIRRLVPRVHGCR